MLSVSLLQRGCYPQEELLIRSRQAPISMRICPRQSGAKLTFFSWLSPTGGAANRQRLFLAHFHSHIMRCILDSKLVTSDQYIARHSPTILHGVPSFSPMPLENTGLSIVPPIRKGNLQLAIF